MYISTLIDGVTHETFWLDFTAYCNEVATSSPKQTFGGSIFEDMGPTFTLLETEVRRRHIKYPHLTREKIYEIMTGYGSESIEMSLRMFDDMDNTPIDYSNMYNYKGTMIDVSKLSVQEVCKLAREVDDIDTFESMEHVRTNYIGAAPNVKLYYPEPFIASPSFIHNDLGFLHILQYQFWLWFCFIFLVCFYFITFLCVLRWCANRNQPRRETRGVSRSKCGDLITATVPVTWALSIIVSESTDATDYYDGFGTNELIVGVRAYQWGWEYYYPKNVDLNYNVKPSYSTLIGNSLRYNRATEKTLGSNDLWKFYQNKTEDSIISPAHLLVQPLDNAKLFNFMNFKNIGIDNLKESSAFKKIRMYSKVYTTNLIHTPTTFTDKYIKLNSLYCNDNDFYNSANYGLKRQHNLTSISATTAINSTFLDQNSMNKFLNYNLQYNNDIKKTSLFNQDLNLLSKRDTNKSTISAANSIDILIEDLNTYGDDALKVLLAYPNLAKTMGDDSDKRTTKYPLTKILNSKVIDKPVTHSNAVVNSLVSDTNISNTTTSEFAPHLPTPTSSKKNFMMNSFNNSVNINDQTTHAYPKDILDRNYLLSGDYDVFAKDDDGALWAVAADYYSRKSNVMTHAEFVKLASNRLFTDDTLNPIISNNSSTSRLNYDSTSTTTTETTYSGRNVINEIEITKSKTSHAMTGVRENPLVGLTTSYWQMFWANANPNLRLDNAIKSSLNQEMFYLPTFTGYYDYDFRNAGAIEMLEEMFWETSYSSYNHLDYLNISDNALKSQDQTLNQFTLDRRYWIKNLNLKRPNYALTRSVLRDLSTTGRFYANNIQLDDYITPANLVNTRDFSLFPIINDATMIDDSYTNTKYMVDMLNKNSSLVLNLTTNFNYPQSYLSVLNNFRADYYDFSWYTDTNLNANNYSTIYSNPTRSSNPITLRSTAKNSLVTYNALQKVFSSRFEEGRSNTRITNFADLRVNQPFMMNGRVSYEKLLAKNKESFYNTSFYNNNTFTVLNDLANVNSSLNFYFFDFPFLLSLTSLPSRFFWFDWYSKWSMVEVQPSSVSKYSINGAPYNRKHFDFNVETGFDIADTETYFTRVSRARKHYLPLWTYTPYLYNRSQVWYKEHQMSLLNVTDETILIDTRAVLKGMHFYWNSLAFSKNTSKHFTPSFSTLNKAVWRPFSSIQAYYYNMGVLTDILTKREYLYRQYLERSDKIINLPKNFTVNPQNPLIHELRSSFALIDPITFNSEYSREFYYSSLTYFKFLIFKDWIRSVSNKLPINLNLVNEYLFFYFLNDNSSSKLGNNSDLFKSQYRPLRRGITNMLRLQGTGAVAMPIEIRLQILASSRDVIHSWAIPSAGIKIDCIPGYTSHRIMIFFTPGIYWGQCMEICGRYHHWMPIIVYFMKRDLFFLWCTHFTSKSDIGTTWSINDRQFTDYIRFASYDKTTWLTELSRNL